MTRPVWLNGWELVYEISGFEPLAVTLTSDIAPASSKEFLDIQATIECGFTLKRVHDMIRTYSQKQFICGLSAHHFFSFLIRFKKIIYSATVLKRNPNVKTCKIR